MVLLFLVPNTIQHFHKNMQTHIKKSLINKFNTEARYLFIKSFGETQLVFNGNTKADHEMNRRIMAKIKTKGKTLYTRYQSKCPLESVL